MFGDVKYFLSGEVSDTVKKILCENGGQQVQYFSDYVTHCIVGQNAAESDISEARELYEIPAVTVDWVLQSVKCMKILPTRGFMAGDNHIFSGLVVCLSKLNKHDRKRLWAMVTYNGGRLQSTLRSSCTHLIVTQPDGAKYARALKCSGMKVVSPDWLLDSLKAGKRFDEGPYHPRYLAPERPRVAALCSSGDETDLQSKLCENASEFQPNSLMRTLLEKLRMSLPWNRLESAGSSDAPTFWHEACALHLEVQNHEAPKSDGPRLLEVTAADISCKMCHPNDSLAEVVNKREKKQQLGERSVTYVPLLASSESVTRGRASVSGGSPRPVVGSHLQQTASIAARRQAAFSKRDLSAETETLLAPQQCLHGSIFHVVGYNEITSKYPSWMQVITKYGGKVVSSYGSNVTHVVCVTLKEPIVKQAVEEGKHCVTAYWLNDVLQEMKMRPPWQAIHLPVAFCEENPCRELRISISQFENEERVRVQLMIQKLGAIFTHSLSRANDILVCKKAAGHKYSKAGEWTIPVVNMLWLNEVYCSNPLSIPNPMQSKYQDFNIDYSQQPCLNSILLASWKKNVHTGHVEHDSTTSSTRKRPHDESVLLQPRAKKQKSEVADHVQRKKLKVVFSMVKEKESLQKKVLQLGGKVVSDIMKATHLVMGEKLFSAKFFCALSFVKFILSDKWIKHSAAAKRFLDEKPYILCVKWQEFPKFSLSSLLEKPKRKKLFKGKTFFVTPNVTPKRNILKVILKAAGATVETRWRTLESLQNAQLDPNNYFVIFGGSDRRLVKYLSDQGFAILHPSQVMTFILKQQVPKP